MAYLVVGPPWVNMGVRLMSNRRFIVRSRIGHTWYGEPTPWLLSQSIKGGSFNVQVLGCIGDSPIASNLQSAGKRIVPVIRQTTFLTDAIRRHGQFRQVLNQRRAIKLISNCSYITRYFCLCQSRCSAMLGSAFFGDANNNNRDANFLR